jgi:hypothetical protein
MLCTSVNSSDKDWLLWCCSTCLSWNQRCLPTRITSLALSVFSKSSEFHSQNLTTFFRWLNVLIFTMLSQFAFGSASEGLKSLLIIGILSSFVFLVVRMVLVQRLSIQKKLIGQTTPRPSGSTLEAAIEIKPLSTTNRQTTF